MSAAKKDAKLSDLYDSDDDVSDLDEAELAKLFASIKAEREAASKKRKADRAEAIAGLEKLAEKHQAQYQQWKAANEQLDAQYAQKRKADLQAKYESRKKW